MAVQAIQAGPIIHPTVRQIQIHPVQVHPVRVQAVLPVVA